MIRSALVSLWLALPCQAIGDTFKERTWVSVLAIKQAKTVEEANRFLRNILMEDIVKTTELDDGTIRIWYKKMVDEKLLNKKELK